ncbi:MAG TPA: hypothetical protein VLE96_04165 [Chlamydiales bacterium]|nr:hypothetical protein [Chlamydiales bacterium]
MKAVNNKPDVTALTELCNNTFEELRTGFRRISTWLAGKDEPRNIIEIVNQLHLRALRNFDAIQTQEQANQSALDIGQFCTFKKYLLKIVPKDSRDLFPDYEKKGLLAKLKIDLETYNNAILLVPECNESKLINQWLVCHCTPFLPSDEPENNSNSK